MPTRRNAVDRDIPTLFYVITGAIGEYKEINFLDKSIEYFDREVSQTYEYVLIDNLGPGTIRVAFRPGLDLSSPITGAKTIGASTSLFINDSVKHITIYFEAGSTVEIVGLSD